MGRLHQKGKKHDNINESYGIPMNKLNNMINKNSQMVN